MSVDTYSRNLVNLLKFGETQEHQILQTLLKWKTIFSKKWWIQNHFDSQPVQSLKNVWKILFKLVESSDSTISIASFNAIGALLISLSPFYTDYLIESFGEFVNQEQPDVTPNTSIAVISTFVFLSHLVGPHRNQNFFETICVLHFFKADLYSFIQYVPQLIKQMSQMNLEFHQSLLISLLTSYVQNPNSQFVESLFCLMEHFPRRLMNEFSHFLDSNGSKLNGLLFAMGSKLLESKLLSRYLTEKQMLIMFEESKKLFEDISSASSLEQAVGILSRLSKMDTKITKDVTSFIDSIFLKDYPLHIKRNLLPLSRKIEYVTPCEGDSSNVLAAKVAALDNFGPEFDSDVISILLKLVYRNDEVFTSVADFLANHLEGFMTRSEKDDKMKASISEIINTIISFSCNDKNCNRNWVQQAAVAGFIEKNNQFKCETYVPDYIGKCVKFLIQTCISPHESLSKKAIQAASSFAGLHNIDLLLSTLLTTVDFFNDNAPYKTILLLNQLYEKVPSPLYSAFIRIFDDIIRNNSSKSLISEFLYFLSHFDSSIFPQNYEKLCMDLMQHYYFSFTRTQLVSNMLVSFDNKDIQPFLQNVTTDIVANPSLNPSDLLEPLHKCFKFLIKTTQPQINLILLLLQLFPSESLNYILKHEITPHQADTLVQDIVEIFNKSQDLHVSALCIKFLAKYSKETLSNLIPDLINMIHAKQVQTAFVGNTYIKAIRKINDTNWNQFAICLLSDLPIVERNLFALKLMKIADDQFKQLIEIQFPFTTIENKPDVCYQWLQQNSMATWPINKNEFSEKVINLLNERKGKIILDTYEMDHKHWNFLFENKQFFDISILKDKRDRIKAHFNLFDHPTTLTSNIFNFKSISDYQKEMNIQIPKLATISPLLKKSKKYVKSVPLLVSFFNYSTVSIPRELFDQIVNKDIEKFAKNESDKNRVREASVEYSKRFGFYEMNNEDQLDINEISNNVVKKKDLRNFCINTTQYTPIAYMDKIASVYSPLIDKIARPKKMYYFIRFLRIVLSMNLRNYQGIRSLVAQLLSNDCIIKVIYSDDGFSDYLLKEVAMLILDNFSIKEQGDYSARFSILTPFLASASILHIQSMIEFEIPSYISLALRMCTLNNTLDPIPYFKQNILLPLSMPLVNKEYAIYLSKHSSLLIGDEIDSSKDQENSGYSCVNVLLKKILDVKYAAIDDYFELIIVLLSYSNANILDFKTNFLDDAINSYYQIGTLVDIIHVYFTVLLREITSDAGNDQPDSISSNPNSNTDTKEPKLASQLRQIFIDEASLIFKVSNKNMTLHNMLGLSTCLINHSSYDNVFIPSYNKLKNENCKMYLSYLVALKVIDVLDQEKHKKFMSKVMKLMYMTKKAKKITRAKVLQMIVKGIKDDDTREKAFLYACSENMELEEIEEIYGMNEVSREQKPNERIKLSRESQSDEILDSQQIKNYDDDNTGKNNSDSEDEFDHGFNPDTYKSITNQTQQNENENKEDQNKKENKEDQNENENKEENTDENSNKNEEDENNVGNEDEENRFNRSDDESDNKDLYIL